MTRHFTARPFIVAVIAVALAALAGTAMADSNYYMAGTYRVELSSGGTELNCRTEPNARAEIVARIAKGETFKAVDVIGSSSSWLKTEQGCYVRGHANYIRKVGPAGE